MTEATTPSAGTTTPVGYVIDYADSPRNGQVDVGEGFTVRSTDGQRDLFFKVDSRVGGTTTLSIDKGDRIVVKCFEDETLDKFMTAVTLSSKMIYIDVMGDGLSVGDVVFEIPASTIPPAEDEEEGRQSQKVKAQPQCAVTHLIADLSSIDDGCLGVRSTSSCASDDSDRIPPPDHLQLTDPLSFENSVLVFLLQQI